MKKIMNLYYEGFPIYIKDYEIENNKFKISLVNIGKETVKKIQFKYRDENVQFDINKDEEDVTIYIDDINQDIIDNIELEYVETNKQIYYLKDFKKKVKVVKPKSVSFLGREKYLYIHDFCKLNKINKHKVKFLPQDNGEFWNCACGEINFRKNKCGCCGLLKESVLSLKRKYEKEAYYTNEKIKSSFSSLIITILAVIILLFYQGVGGDFFFANETKNNFFGTMNRIIIPILIVVVNSLNIFSISRYKVKLERFLTILSLGLLLYLNAVSALFTINTAYNIILLLILDVTNIISFVAYCKKTNRIDKVKLVSLIVVLISIFVSSIKIIEYSKYDLKVIEQGIQLKVEVDEHEKKYIVPEKLDGMHIVTIVFDDNINYNIEELTIPRYVGEVLMSSHKVLKELSKIHLSSENTKLYEKQGVIYNSSNLVELVPNTVKTLTLNDTIIHKESFKDALFIEKVILTKEVKGIEYEAFSGCEKLSIVDFSEENSLEYIEDYAFKNVAIKELCLPNSLKKIGVGILQGCNKLEKLEAPFVGLKRETEVENYAATDIFTKFFCAGDYSQSQYIPISLREVKINDISLIHNVTFYNCENLENIILPDEMIHMGIRCFYNCNNLKEFNISNGIEVIKESCFENCSSMKKIYIPKSVTKIETNAFKNCQSLTEVIYDGNINDLIIEDGNDCLKNILFQK